jgi:hypothetical protein
MQWLVSFAALDVPFMLKVLLAGICWPAGGEVILRCVYAKPLLLLSRPIAKLPTAMINANRIPFSIVVTFILGYRQNVNVRYKNS